MKRQLLSLSVLLTVTLSAALNDAFHARNGVSSALKSTNTHKPLPMDESVFNGVVDQEERSLGIHVTIHLYDFCDCPDGPKCPHHLYECPNGKYCGEQYKCDGELYSQDYGVVDKDETEEVYLVPCNEVNGNENLSTIQVKWFFFVETNTQDPSNVVDKVCGVMGTAVLDAAFDDEVCSFESHHRRHLEIKGYSEEVTCTHYEDCMPTDEGSESCGVYEATIVVGFDDEGEDNASASQVSSTVTGAASDTFENDDIKNTVNEQLDDTGEAATVVGYGNPNGNQEASAGINGEVFQDQDSGNRLTRAGKAAIAAMAALMVLLLLLCCICWRRRRNQSHEDKSVGSGNTELSPSRRLFGSRSGSRSGGSQTDDDMTYMTSDFNNLGMHHSKLDVHACSSASCDQCNPIMRQQTAGVYFVGSQGGSPLSDILEEECKSSSEYKSELGSPEEDEIGNDAIPPPPSHPPPNDDNGAKGKKRFFSRFRRNKAQSTGTPVVQPLGDGEGGDEQIEIEI